jgi:hypothetical protein
MTAAMVCVGHFGLLLRLVQELPKALVEEVKVGAGGVEPPSSSVSGGSGAFEEQGDATPCFTAPQMAGPIGHGTVVYREAA